MPAKKTEKDNVTKMPNPNGSKDEAKRTFFSAAANSAKSVYQNAEDEGKRYGKKLARKTLQAQFASKEPEEVIATLLAE